MSFEDHLVLHSRPRSYEPDAWSCQGAVAKRTAELGAGLKLPSIKGQDILKCVNRVMEEPGFKEGALKVSESFKNAGGIEEAVAFIEQIGKNTLDKTGLLQ